MTDATQLILENLHLVDPLARRAAARLPRWLELDDLVQTGRIALVESAKKFDASRGVAFAAFATKRILGAIYDANRRKNYQWELHRDGMEQDFVDHTAEKSIERDIERGQMSTHIGRALDELTEDERMAVVNHALHEMNYSEIGQSRERSTTWAFYQARAGREKARRSLSRIGITSGVI